MTSPDVPESDWQDFRELREVALDRYCERALARVEELDRFTQETRDRIELLAG